MLFGEAVSMATPIPTTERAQVTCFHESFPPSLLVPPPRELPAQPQGHTWSSPREKHRGCRSGRDAATNGLRGPSCHVRKGQGIPTAQHAGTGSTHSPLPQGNSVVSLPVSPRSV